MIRDNLRKRYTARWWENRDITEDELNYVLECAYLSPSKQCRYDHKIFVFTDSDLGKDFKRWLYWDNTCCVDTVRGSKEDGVKRYNGQVLASIFLLWVANRDLLETRNDCMVSATIAMMAAEEIGLQTGFCGCIGADEIKEKLKIDETAVIGLGIGTAVTDNQLKRPVFQDGKEVGFDLSNTDPTMTRARERVRKPSFKDLIKIF